MTNVHDEQEVESMGNRPDGREGRDDAKERLARLPTHFKLDEIQKQIKGESEWEQTGRNQFALFHAGALRVGFFGFQAGTGIEDHKVNGHVAVHVLQGRVEVSGGGRQPTSVGPNEFIGLDGMKTFTLKAQEETFAVIAFEQGESIAEPARGNDQGTQITR